MHVAKKFEGKKKHSVRLNKDDKKRVAQVQKSYLVENTTEAKHRLISSG